MTVLVHLQIRWHPDYDAECYKCGQQQPTPYTPSGIGKHGENWNCPNCGTKQVLYESDLRTGMIHNKTVV